jgi:hypothetical protein
MLLMAGSARASSGTENSAAPAAPAAKNRFTADIGVFLDYTAAARWAETLKATDVPACRSKSAAATGSNFMRGGRPPSNPVLRHLPPWRWRERETGLVVYGWEEVSVEPDTESGQGEHGVELCFDLAPPTADTP